MTVQGHLLPPRWNANRIRTVTGLALAAPLEAAALERGQSLLAPLLLAIALAVLWPLAFARMRQRHMGWDGIVPSLVFVLLPGSVPLWQQGLALSFGLAMGDLIFGKRGRGFLNPTVVGLAFLLFSSPGVPFERQGNMVAIAGAASAVILLATELLSWRIAVGFVGAVGTMMALLIVPFDRIDPQSAFFVLGVAFLIGDPVAAACTNAGRWSCFRSMARGINRRSGPTLPCKATFPPSLR